MKPHPLADIFPLIEGAEFDALVADIAAHGLREPVTLLEGMVLDGRARLGACERIGLVPRFEEFGGADPLGFVLERNRSRYSASQRAMAAARLVSASRRERDKRQEAKSGWIERARAEFAPGSRCACEICGKYSGLTEAHHLVPLTAQFESGAVVPIQEFGWLCPTHHAAVHLSINALIGNRAFSLADLGMSPEEADKISRWNIRFIELFTSLPEWAGVRA